MGIGIILLEGLIFVVTLISLAIWGLRRDLHVHNRWLRAVLLGSVGLLALVGIFPIANMCLSFLGFYSHPDPIAALAEIFPSPLPKDIQPVEAYRENSSDYWSLYIAVRVGPGDLSTLHTLRNLTPSTGRNDLTFELPTTVKSPAFWPRQNCPDLVVYEEKAETFKKLPPPGTWEDIRLFYCPQDHQAFVWVVDVD
jgi:hypothetical protein